MRLASFLVGLAILGASAWLATRMPLTVETRCTRADDRVRCTGITRLILGEERAELGPGDEAEARAVRVGSDEGNAFRPVLAVGKDAFELPQLVDTHAAAVGIARAHTALDAAVEAPVPKTRLALVVVFGLLGLALAVSSLRARR